MCASGRLLLVGVTGGIASGKSMVAGMLEERGARIVDFDDLARRVVEPDEPAWRDIADHFGESVLHDDRTVDRKTLGEIVFHDVEQRRILEGFTHPRIRELFHREVASIRSQHPEAVIVAVVPLLIENDMQPLFDLVVVVHVPEEIQIQRLMERDGLSRGGAVNRLRTQMPIDDKVAAADTVIDNSGLIAVTRRQVEQLWEDLRRMVEESPDVPPGCS